MKKILFFFLIIFASNTFAQESSKPAQDNFDVAVKIELFPIDLLYKPNYTNPFEAKIGTQFTLNENKLQLDIGTAKDILRYYHSPNLHFGFGAEFFTWTMLKSESDFKFPVVTVDYFFGIYFSNLYRTESFTIRNRLRVGHISAHLVDGSYDVLTNKWNNNLLPFVYSREFLELSTSLDYDYLRTYFGFNYLFHTIPSEEGKINFNLGSEVFIYRLEELHSTIFIGLDLKLLKGYSAKYRADKNFTVGFHIGDKVQTGLRVYYQYYSGGNIHGEFSYQSDKRSSIGVNLVF